MLDKQKLVFGSKISGLEYRDRPAVYALIQNDDRKLAIIRSKDRYFLPGGGLEGSESHHECLTRECTEEIGYDIEVGPYIGKASHYLISFKSGEPVKIIGSFYGARLVRFNNLKSEDDHELIWLSPETAIEKMYVEFQAWAIREFIGNQL